MQLPRPPPPPFTSRPSVNPELTSDCSRWARLGLVPFVTLLRVNRCHQPMADISAWAQPKIHWKKKIFSKSPKLVTTIHSFIWYRIINACESYGLGWGAAHSRTGTDTPCFIALCFPTLRRHCISYKLKVGGNPALGKSTGAISPTALVHFVSLGHILVIPSIFQVVSCLLHLLRRFVSSDPWYYCYDSLKAEMLVSNFLAVNNFKIKACALFFFRQNTTAHLIDDSIV